MGVDDRPVEPLGVSTLGISGFAVLEMIAAIVGLEIVEQKLGRSLAEV